MSGAYNGGGIAMEHEVNYQTPILPTCPCCMETHNVTIIAGAETTAYKGMTVTYQAEYSYCPETGIYYEDERQMTQNYKRMVEEYKELCRRGKNEHSG